MDRLPVMQISRETDRKRNPVGSNCRIGTMGLQRNVKIGEYRNNGIVFLPKYTNNAAAVSSCKSVDGEASS